MENKTQIICFIAPRKFAGLLGNELPTKIGFRKDGANLDNGNELVYVSENGKVEIGAFNEDLARNASIILIPDTFNFQYIPLVSFTVVSHGETPAEKVQTFINLKLCEGHEKSWEEEFLDGKETIYKKIANLIKQHYESNI